MNFLPPEALKWHFTMQLVLTRQLSVATYGQSIVRTEK
jgi:hypothetical protein